jgi:uncharacterized protein (TIGR02145 family)
MKTISGWNEGVNGTNASGLSLLPGGYRYGFDAADFVIAGNFACMWTATETSEGSAYDRLLLYTRNDLKRSTEQKTFGMSVRCVKDLN